MGKTHTWPAWEAAVGGDHGRFRGAEVFFTAHPGQRAIDQTDKDTGRRNRVDITEVLARVAGMIR